MLDQKSMIYVGVLVHADGYDGKIRHGFVKRKQAWQLFDARSAKGGPKIENNDMSTQFAQIEGLRSIGQYKLRRGSTDIPGTAPPIAANCQQYHQRQTDPRCTHNTLQFL
jgi:hypothetical protein